MIGKKAQTATEDIIWVIIELVILAMAGFSIWFYAYHKIENNDFEEQFLARDIALTVDAMQASPSNIRYFYYLPERNRFNILFSINDETKKNRIIISSSEEKFGYYPFITYQENIKKFKLEKKNQEKKGIILLKTRDFFEITDEPLTKSLFHIPEEKFEQDKLTDEQAQEKLDKIISDQEPISKKCELEIPDVILLDPLTYEGETYAEKKSEMSAAIADAISAGIKDRLNQPVFHTRQDKLTSTDSSITERKRKEDSTIAGLRELVDAIISIGIAESNANTVKIFYPYLENKCIEKENRALAILILNKLTEDKELALDGVSLIPLIIEENSILSEEKISFLIEVNTIAENSALSLNEKRTNIADAVIAVLAPEKKEIIGLE